MKNILILFAAVLACESASGQVLIDHYRSGSAGNNGLLTGLQAYWKFDESSGDAADSSGNTRTFIENGTVAAEPTGAINTSRLHESNNDTDWFAVADGAWNDFGTNDFTVAFWTLFSQAQGAPQDQAILTKGDALSGISWSITLDRGTYSNDLAFIVYQDEAGTSGAFPPQFFPPLEIANDFSFDEYTFVFLRRSGTNFTFGIANESEATITQIQTLEQEVDFFDSGAELVIGTWLFGGAGSTSGDLQGAVDEMGIWNVALSDCQLLKLFRKTPFAEFDSDACD